MLGVLVFGSRVMLRMWGLVLTCWRLVLCAWWDFGPGNPGPHTMGASVFAPLVSKRWDAELQPIE